MNYQDKISGRVTSIDIPPPRPKARERWRDAGDGMIECEITGRRVPLLAARSVLLHDVARDRSMQFTEEEWAKLVALAAHRSQIEKNNPQVRKPVTPADCVRGFIASCVVDSQWVHPATKAAE